MRWMIQGATIMTQDDDDRWLENGDIAVDGDRILAIGHNVPPESLGVEKVIDGRNKLVMPGLINAHHHSHDRFDKGRLDNLPLEVWQVIYNPPLGRRDWTPKECYLRTALNCMEMLKIGTTTVIDDVIHGVPPLKQNIDAVFQAYQDMGMRAFVSIYYSDRPFARTIPYLEDLLPERLKADLAQMPTVAPDEMIEIWRRYGENWRDRVRFIISPSAPQRCTDEFLKKTWKLANDLDVPVTVHVLETKSQVVTGRFFYGKSIVEHMDSLGILTPKTTLAHMVWVTDHDLDLVARAGASIAHNPMTNLKCGSGIAPVRKMLDAGINVGLGTDNNCANDTSNLLETMRVAALLHKVTDFDYDRWIGSREVIKMATRGGARCACLDGEIGTLSVGKKADLILLDLNRFPFFPRNDLRHQLIFCEHGESVDAVVIDGKFIVEGGKVKTVNEEKILSDVMERAKEILNKITQAAKRGGELAPYVREAYYKCVRQDVGFSAYSKS